MTKKKHIIISIISILILIIIVSASTYAYFIAKLDEIDVGTDSGELSVLYEIDENITGEVLVPSTTYENGIKSVAKARLNTGSVKALFNLYITPTTFDSALAISPLKWHVDVVDYNNNIVDSYSGNFVGKKEGEAFKVIDGYELTLVDTTFNIYIWLDSSLVVQPINDKRFVANISADTVDITGTF